jgi:hypothetical protein
MTNVTFDKITNRIKDMQQALPQIKERVATLTSENVIKQIKEDEQKAKWDSMNMGIDQWKKKYLYPFGDITSTNEQLESSFQINNTPSVRYLSNQRSFHNKSLAQESIFSAEDSQMPAQASQSYLHQNTDSNDFVRIAKEKFSYPASAITRQEWLDEL